ncbi:MAG: 2-keto-myo-inositol isomerase [Blastocatellia bacterium]|jgi:2-keto-myo-inositol isomerase|nr:2-keto-myo-inositol isomerase [Blastocatellia bacterium]
MKLALNGATTMKADLRTDILAAHAAGFDVLEIWAAKLRHYLNKQSGSSTELKEFLSASSMKPWSINSIEHITFRTADDYERIKMECEELSAIAAAIDCPYVVVVPGKLPSQPLSREIVIEESTRVLLELGAIAESDGVGLAFEFLGQTDCSVQTLDLASEIVERVARANVGLVIDSFHFYAGGSSIEMIDALNPERLFIFHINDAEDLPRAQLQDSHRLLPGLGILPLREMLQAFKRIGYDRVASVEIFRPEYWERDPFQLAREAKSALEKVLVAT